jgi:hypothetical protein
MMGVSLARICRRGVPGLVLLSAFELSGCSLYQFACGRLFGRHPAKFREPASGISPAAEHPDALRPERPRIRLFRICNRRHALCLRLLQLRFLGSLRSGPRTARKCSRSRFVDFLSRRRQLVGQYERREVHLRGESHTESVLEQLFAALRRSLRFAAIGTRDDAHSAGPGRSLVSRSSRVRCRVSSGSVDDAQAHPEYNLHGGQTMFVTYSEPTSTFGSQFRLVAVQLERP